MLGRGRGAIRLEIRIIGKSGNSEFGIENPLLMIKKDVGGWRCVRNSNWCGSISKAFVDCNQQHCK